MTFDYYDYQAQFPECVSLIEEMLMQNLTYKTIPVAYFIKLLKAYKDDGGEFDMDDIANETEDNSLLNFLDHPNRNQMHDLRAQLILNLKSQLESLFTEMFKEVKDHLDEERNHGIPDEMDAYRLKIQRVFNVSFTSHQPKGEGI